jgi:hypothetical protein
MAPLYVQTSEGIIPVATENVNRAKIGRTPQLIDNSVFSTKGY